MFNTRCRCFVIFFLSHFYRYVCHSLNCRLEWAQQTKTEKSTKSGTRTTEPWTQFIHFSFSGAIFHPHFLRSISFDSEWFHVHRSRSLVSLVQTKSEKRKQKKNSTIQKMWTNKLCIFFILYFSIQFFFCFIRRRCSLGSALWYFHSVRSRNIALGCVPTECVSKMLFILENMLVRAMHLLVALQCFLLCFQIFAAGTGWHRIRRKKRSPTPKAQAK